jgi:hypothetical protein
VSTDREVLVELLDAIDDAFGGAPVPVRLAHAAGAAVRHLRSTDPGDRSPEVERASRAAYAAGAAHGVDARPDRRQGATVDP